jgi:ankyrin repeat protein
MSVFDRLFGEKSRKKEVEEKRKKSDNTERALARAALYGHAEAVRVLLDAGANVNARTIISSWTPLMAAASEGKIEIMRILFDRGADINAENPGGTTALTIAARNGHTDTVQVLLDRGADVNQRSPDGVSALSAAAAFGQTHIVRLLLSKGARDDGNALRAATQIGHKEIIDLLRDS